MLRLGIKRKPTDKPPTKKIKRIDEDISQLSSDVPSEKTIPLGSNLDEVYEKQLEASVFGKDDDVLKNLENEYQKKSVSHVIVDSDQELENDTSTHKNVPRPAWMDDDEEENEDDIEDEADDIITSKKSELEDKKKRDTFVAKKFAQVMGDQPKWAKLKHERQSVPEISDSEDENESGNRLLKRGGDHLSKSATLLKGTINMKKCADLNKGHRDISIIKHVEFHPNAQVAAIAGVSGNVSLFQVDGRTNPKIQTIHFDDFSIERAHFSTDGEQLIVVSKQQPFYYYYDMIAGKINKVHLDKGMNQKNIHDFELSPDGKYIAMHGKYGNIHILSSKSKEWISSVKMNGNVKAVAFNRNSTQMYSYGTDGEVYIWDMRNWGNCCHKFVDDGSIRGSALCLSPNQQYLACGSNSGVVNIYDVNKVILSNTPKPEKILLNLTTEITDLKFNSTSEILTMLSSKKENAIKLVHLPSFTVFSNFPNLQESIKRPSKADMSLNSGYLTIANNTGRALLYRLKHYKNY